MARQVVTIYEGEEGDTVFKFKSKYYLFSKKTVGEMREIVEELIRFKWYVGGTLKDITRECGKLTYSGIRFHG